MDLLRGPGLALFAVLLVAVPASAQSATLDLIETPDVVVANEAGEAFESPSYPFTATVRLTNGEERKNISLQAITYIDKSVDGCPQEGTDHPPPRIYLVRKQFDLNAGESRTIGGSTNPEVASQEPDRYWPLVVSKTYKDRDGNNISYEEGEHSFCIVAIDVDRAQECPSLRECTLDRAAFEAYVRRNNQAPAITDLSFRPDNPRVGQSTVLSAEAVDNSTTPRQDTLSYTWVIRGERLSGSTVQHAFDSQGFQEVRLEVSDGFDTVNRTVEVPVGNVSRPSEDTSSDVPAPGAVAVAAVLAGLAVVRRRS